MRRRLLASFLAAVPILLGSSVGQAKDLCVGYRIVAPVVGLRQDMKCQPTQLAQQICDYPHADALGYSVDLTVCIPLP